MKESDLYPPVKAVFEARGFTVKGEVGAADIVAMKEGAPPVVVELKRGLTLSLYHQALARQALTDAVYIAVPAPRGAGARRVLADNLRMCRRLGLGFVTVAADGLVTVRCEPRPTGARRDKARAAWMTAAFDRLRGDPNAGGATRHGLVTGYRQDALACAAYLAHTGPEKGALVARATGVARATRLMRDNHYGWFRRLEPGVYDLTDAGRQGLRDWAESGVPPD